MDARQSLAADKRAPRLILDDIEESSDSVMNLTSGISDIKQIYNYRYNYQTNHKDDYSVLLGMCLEQNESSFDLFDNEQGFIREINFRIGKKPSIVLFLNHTIVDLNRFCTMNAPSNYFSHYQLIRLTRLQSIILRKQHMKICLYFEEIP